MKTAEGLADALHARRCGSAWMAPCPVNEADGQPHEASLAIREKNGKILFHCHAGCSQRDVIEALKDRGLWEHTEEWSEWRAGIRYPAEWGTAIHEYRYTDAAGEFLYSVVRFSPKSFRPGYFNAGRWVWKKHPQQVLYHLLEITEAPIVFLVEGEKDSETLRDWGFVATTVAGGAKAPWLPQFTETLRGREVILVPDNDGPGWERALEISRELFGCVARLRVFDLPDGVKDISDWFAAGHSECELIAMLEGCHAV